MVHSIPIDDPDDARVAPYRDVRERDLVGRQGRFIAEGTVVLRSLLQCRGHIVLSVLIAEKRLAAATPLLAQLAEDVPVYSAAPAVLDAIAGFHLHRGVLALGARRPEPSPDDLLASLGPRALVVVLAAISNHDNIGGVFRNAAAFGADAVLLNSECCDPLYRKAIRVSVGATLLVPYARFEAGAAVADRLAGLGFETLALSPSGAERLCDVVRPDRIAALFGAEGPGLAPEVLARTRTVRIPMAAGFDSLNVATASGIVLHHLAG